MGERELALLTPLNLGVAKMLIINNRDFKERPPNPEVPSPNHDLANKAYLLSKR